MQEENDLAMPNVIEDDIRTHMPHILEILSPKGFGFEFANRFNDQLNITLIFGYYIRIGNKMYHLSSNH